MLHTETVSRTTLELLNKLVDDPILQDFFLVGGTALSLQIGHRKSIDLDFFNLKDFDEVGLLEKLESSYGFSMDFQSRSTLKGAIGGVKVDLIAHKYRLTSPLLVVEQIRMAGLEDIAAMKLNAIAGNGTRVKDFIDLAYLSSLIPYAKIIDAYQHKYATRNPVMVIKAITYFKDIDFKEPIEMTGKKYSWKKVEKRLQDMLNMPNRVFEPME